MPRCWTRKPKPQVGQGSAPAVIATTHGAYLQHLPRVLQSINAQGGVISQKILVCDDCEPTPEAARELDGWKVLTTTAHNPNVARNLALEHVAGEWVIFWDGDNFMSPGYVAQLWGTPRTQSTGVVYPSVRYVDSGGRPLKELSMPEWDYWTARRVSVADTSSLWNVHALRTVGGFDPLLPLLDDYAATLKISRAGWSGKRSGAWVSLTQHPERRSHGVRDGALSRVWTFGLLTLWSGRSGCEEKLMLWLQRAELPPKLHLYWVDNSGNPNFRAYLLQWAGVLGRPVTIIDAGKPHEIRPGDHYLSLERHQHVANLYNEALAHIHEDAVIFLEDDVIPPLDGFPRLMKAFWPYRPTAASVGVYRSRTNPAHICAARDRDVWRDVPKFDELPAEPFQVGMSGGGFAIYANWALKAAGAFRAGRMGEYFMGWDGNLGRTFTAHGWQMWADGRVKCEHRCPEVLQFLERTT